MAQQEAEADPDAEFPVPELICQIHPDGTTAITATAGENVIFDATVPVERAAEVLASAGDETIATWSELVSAAAEEQPVEREAKAPAE